VPESPFLIVGLGNPGRKYAQTRHNVGFIVVDELVRRWGGSATAKFGGEVFSFPDRRVHLLKPQTFMNLSGESVQPAAAFFKVPVDTQLMVVSDDLDLPVGHLRIRKAGGAGGHNGLKSIIELLGTEGFPRLRIGIGRPAPGATTGHVLGKISKSEEALFDEAVKRSADALEAWMSKGIETCMNEFNRKKDEP
jgi:peptidyl-tRNA hydrolase, PTH1 family